MRTRFKIYLSMCRNSCIYLQLSCHGSQVLKCLFVHQHFGPQHLPNGKAEYTLRYPFPDVVFFFFFAMVIDINSDPPGEGIHILIENVLLVIGLKTWKNNEDGQGHFLSYRTTVWMLSQGAFSGEVVHC